MLSLSPWPPGQTWGFSNSLSWLAIESVGKSDADIKRGENVGR